jgi:hypothetical protein
MSEISNPLPITRAETVRSSLLLRLRGNMKFYLLAEMLWG